MVSTATAAAIAGLRDKRRDLRREVARVRWWRRLLQARRDLIVGQLTAATESATSLDAAWEALLADAPTSSELASVMWPEGDHPSPSSLQRIEAIDARLDSYETRLRANLDAVTQHMAEIMGESTGVEDIHGA